MIFSKKSLNLGLILLCLATGSMQSAEKKGMGMGGSLCDPKNNGSDCASGICFPDLPQIPKGCSVDTFGNPIIIPQPQLIFGADGKPTGVEMVTPDCTPQPVGFCTCITDAHCTSNSQCVFRPDATATFKGKKVKNCEYVCPIPGAGVNKAFGCKCLGNGECGVGLICNEGICDVPLPANTLETLQSLKNVMREIKETAQAFSQAPKDQRIHLLIALQDIKDSNVGISRLVGHLQGIAKIAPDQLKILAADPKLISGLVDLLNNLAKALAPLSLKPNDIKVIQANPTSSALDDMQKAIAAFAQYGDLASQMEKAMYDLSIQFMKRQPKKSPQQCLNFLV